jgi:hypothetical protein
MGQFGLSGRLRQAFGASRLDATGRPTGRLMAASDAGDRLVPFLG